MIRLSILTECFVIIGVWGVRELGETATSIAEKAGISQPTVNMSFDGGEKTVNKKGLEL